MKGRIIGTTKVALFLLVLSLQAFAQAPTKPASIELKDLKGHNFRLADYKGKVVLVNFWATWCPPCRTEIPELIRWQREYRSRGLRVIGITYPPQKRSEVQGFVRKARVNYPVVLGTKATKLLFTPSETLPMTVVIDSQGNVHEMLEGIVFPDEFDQKIKPLLTSQILRNVIRSQR